MEKIKCTKRCISVDPGLFKENHFRSKASEEGQCLTALQDVIICNQIKAIFSKPTSWLPDNITNKEKHITIWYHELLTLYYFD